jgi:Domain of unknown function (DUF4375)
VEGAELNPPGTPFLDRARDAALKRLGVSREDPRCLGVFDQTILAVSSAQGVIDNGGFRDFFEGDWPGKPPYSFFSDAYRRIGAEAPAKCIDQAAALFRFKHPERHNERRQRFLQQLPDSHELITLGDTVCGDVTVWQRLEQYARNHSGH